MEEKLMVTEKALAEIGSLQQKAEVALDCILEDSRGRRTQVLADIARDYIIMMDERIEAMHMQGMRR